MASTKSLSSQELDALLAVARKHSERDYLMLLLTFNHGLRVSETLSITQDNVANGFLAVKRGKGSNPVNHPLTVTEKELLAGMTGSFFPMTRRTFHRRMREYGAEAGIPEFKCHPHVLKHTCGRLGFKNGMSVPDLVAYLGHKNPANSLRYAQSTEEEAAQAFAGVAR